MSESSYALGVCAKHRYRKITRGSALVCLKCEGERAPRPDSPKVVKPDPGPEAMMKLLLSSGVMLHPDQIKAAREQMHIAPIVNINPVVPEAPQYEIGEVQMGFEESLNEILTLIEKLPMPEDIKQFKAVLKLKKQVQKLLTKE